MIKLKCNIFCNKGNFSYAKPYQYLNLICKIHGLFPNVIIPLTTLLINPVATALGKQCFSKLKLVKTIKKLQCLKGSCLV